jgi:molybdopterin converting factor small subunit
VSDIRQALTRLWPDVSSLLAASAIAVNDDYAADDRVIAPNDDVALIPPVSGGGGIPARRDAPTQRATT